MPFKQAQIIEPQIISSLQPQQKSKWQQAQWQNACFEASAGLLAATTRALTLGLAANLANSAEELAKTLASQIEACVSNKAIPPSILAVVNALLDYAQLNLIDANLAPLAEMLQRFDPLELSGRWLDYWCRSQQILSSLGSIEPHKLDCVTYQALRIVQLAEGIEGERQRQQAKSVFDPFLRVYPTPTDT